MSNNEDLSSPSSLSSNLFKLSTPFQCFHHDLEYKNNKMIMTKKITNDLLFNFNQPYQAQSFHQLPFKSKIIKNNNRNHPYNNSTATTSTSRLDLDSNHYIDNRIVNSSVNSSNSILAHLKSLSPNFKSIFIRPKTHKPIDASCLINKTKIHNKNVLSMETSRNNKNSTPFLTNLLPRIELKELRFNSSVDDILKKFTTEDDVIRRTIKNVTSSSTTLATTNNNRSTTTTSVNKSKLDKQHSTFFITGILSSDESNDSSRSSTTTTMNQSHLKNSDLINNKSKWTCMICLSKHSTRLDVCSICGSSKSSSVTLKNIQEMTSPSSTTSSSSSSTTSSSTMTTTSNSNLASSLKKKQHQSTPLSSSTPSSSPSSKLFSSYLINELGLKQKLQQQTILPSSEDESIRSTNKTPKKNPYNKKWSCLHCNYQNDNLKIVCLNCRWAKTMPPPSSKAMTETNLIDSSIKRSKKQSTFDNLLVTTVDLTSDEQKIVEPLKDKNNNVYCSSCKSPISKEKSSSPTKETTEIQSVSSPSLSQIITEKSTTETTSFFVKQTSTDKKWNCTTCLVANLESNDKCVCCMTPKPNQQKLDEIKTQISLKWKCDTCLVQNEADKNSCVCCMTPKPGASGSTKSASSLSSSSSLLPKFPETTNLLTTITPSNIKIGTNNNTSLPIKFDSIFKLPTNTADQQQPANNKTFSFGLPSQSSENTPGEKTTYSEPQVATPKFSFTPTSSSSLTNEKTPFSLSTPSSSNNNQLTFPSFPSLSTNNKTDIPTFNTSMTNSNNNFFTANSTPKTDNTSTVNNNLPTLNFFSKPTDIAPNVTLTSNNLFGQTSFSTNNPSAFNSTTNLFSKPSFSNFSTQENNMPTFGNINTVPASSSSTTTAAAIQSFPLFDFKSSTSFPNLNSQSKGFQFGSFNNTTTDQINNNSTSTTSFMPSLNPIINFVANPNAIIFSGNNETGMNSTAEVSSQRRYRKAIRKNR